MKTYKVYSSRWDDSEKFYTSFHAENDEDAKLKSEEMSKRKDNAWDMMRMLCVEQMEITRQITHNENYQRMLDS